jgi:signal transduction histidine kinase
MRSFALSVPDFFIWILNMLIILMISHWYAQIEEESTNRLLETQKNLAQEVDKKTQELEARTRELEILNEQLEERVAEEVQKNRNQEQMLFMQARYAQMGEVLSMIAHQWRQPLNAVSSSITTMQVILRSGDCNIEALSNKTKRVEGYVQHLSKTIDDFRNFFREDKEKCHLTLCDIVHDAMNLMYPLLKEDHISIEIGKECRCTILSYPNEILHVVLNILSNARDVLLHQDINKKYIHINMYDDETHAYLEIEDWGGGIDEEIIEKIFDPYFTTKEENGGTGLGLYMSKLIIERHCRGRLSVENTSKGARFKMAFPIVAHHLEAK